VQGLGIDDPVSMYRGGGMYWYHKDALGSIYQMTDEDETVVRSYDYSAFGPIVTETGALENPFTYTAREYDDDSTAALAYDKDGKDAFACLGVHSPFTRRGILDRECTRIDANAGMA
jgi:hypothetical protein